MSISWAYITQPTSIYIGLEGLPARLGIIYLYTRKLLAEQVPEPSIGNTQQADPQQPTI